MIKTPLTYYGGKQSMLKFIHPLVPNHTVYCEPFLGGGALFWSKKEVRCEMINDINNNIITFYEIIKSGRTRMFDKLVRNSLLSRYQHTKAYRIYHRIIKNPTRPEIAWAVWYLGNLSFNGDFDGSIKFSRSDDRSYTYLRNDKNRMLNPKLIKRLEKTQIDNRDALDVIKAMDSPKTFFYIDPPYIGADQGHYDGYTKEQFLELLNVLKDLKGKFLLSCYPGKEIRSYCAKNKWHYKNIRLSSAASAVHGQRTAKVEHLSFNYDEKSYQTKIKFQL